MSGFIADVKAEGVLEKAWRDACTVVLGEEIGPMEEYAGWLGEHVEKPSERQSSRSAKRVVHSVPDYCAGSKSLSFDEVDFGGKFEPLHIDKIKDIDSIAEALRERICYTGNIVLGNSGFVENSSNISDSFYLSDSLMCDGSRKMAFASLGRFWENMFGCDTGGDSKYCIRCFEVWKMRRSLEAYFVYESSDLYYCHWLWGCNECLFSFNQRSKNYLIGNLELPKDKYMETKKGLLEELGEELKQKKRLPSLPQLLGAQKSIPDNGWGHGSGGLQCSREADNAFTDTSRVLFGKPLDGIQDYEGWLLRHIRGTKNVQSAFSGENACLSDYACMMEFPADRIITIGEQEQASGLKISEGEARGIGLKNAGEIIGKIAYFCPDMDMETQNNVGCSVSCRSMHGYKCLLCTFSKYTGCSFWPRNSSHIFGSSVVFESSFCINCYNSVRLNRCFEADSSRECSGSCFLHNCENVHDSMFCFNVKNLRNAIGNAGYPLDEYKRVKSALLGQIYSELEEKKGLRLDIYNVGCP